MQLLDLCIKFASQLVSSFLLSDLKSERMEAVRRVFVCACALHGHLLWLVETASVDHMHG